MQLITQFNITCTVQGARFISVFCIMFLKWNQHIKLTAIAKSQRIRIIWKILNVTVLENKVQFNEMLKRFTITAMNPTAVFPLNIEINPSWPHCILKNWFYSLSSRNTNKHSICTGLKTWMLLKPTWNQNEINIDHIFTLCTIHQSMLFRI